MDRYFRVGSQKLIPIGEHFRFAIHKVMPERGFKFKFGVRDKIINECVAKAKLLEIVFPEFPDITLVNNPIGWKNLGEKKKQPGLYKDSPMIFYWYYVDFRGELTSKKIKTDENQAKLF